MITKKRKKTIKIAETKLVDEKKEICAFNNFLSLKHMKKVLHFSILNNIQ